MSRVAMRKRGIRIAAVLLLIMGSAFAKVRKLETVQTDGSVSVVRPRVALTFDDEPSPKYTPILLDGLKERNVHATFFLLGKNIKKNQKLVQRMQKEGHLLGNHTYNHVQLDKISETTAKQEILRTNNEIYETAGIYPEYMRSLTGPGRKIWNCVWKCFRCSGILIPWTGRARMWKLYWRQQETDRRMVRSFLCTMSTKPVWKLRFFSSTG